MITPQSTLEVAAELITEGNHKDPLVKLALWGALLSPNKQLSWNALQLDELRPYTHGNLPLETEEVWHIVRKGHRFASRNEAARIIHVERLDRAGLLDWVGIKPGSADEWDQWRRKVAQIPGLSWKTTSFAALLLWPLESPLVPVDRHVCARLGLPMLGRKISAKNERAYGRYKAIEQIVESEWTVAGRPVPLGVWHWYKWSEWRQITGDEPIRDRPESHTMLSPYIWFPNHGIVTE